MADYGILPEGFALKPIDQLVTDVISRLRPSWGASFDFTDASPVGGSTIALRRRKSA